MIDSAASLRKTLLAKNKLVLIGLASSSLLILLYIGFMITIYMAQENLIFRVNAIEAPLPTSAELPGLERVMLTTNDGERIIAWFIAGKANKPLILYFHGNGDRLKERVRRFNELTKDGHPLLAIDYRGYGGSTGSPSEAGLTFDARAALDEAQRRGFAAKDIILYGESLGTTLATRLAAYEPFRGLILEAPFPSISDIAEVMYFYIPIDELVKYPFDVSEAIKHVKAPLLVLHGRHDEIVMEELSRQQFDAAPEPKQWLSVADGGHLVMMRPDVLPQVQTWIAARDE